MSLTWELSDGVFRNAVSDLVVDPLPRSGPAVDERNVEQDVVEVRLGDRRPNHASHLVDDSFACQSFAESAKHFCIIKWLGQALLTLPHANSIALISRRRSINSN